MFRRWWRQLFQRPDPRLERLSAAAARLLGADMPASTADARHRVLEEALALLERTLHEMEGLRRLQQERQAVRLETARRLIALRDWLLGQLPRTSGPEHAALDAVNRKLAEALRTHGVAILEDQGPVDAERHQVVDTAPAPDESRHGHIAATSRPGYAIDGRLIRPQEVVVFSHRPIETSRHF